MSSFMVQCRDKAARSVLSLACALLTLGCKETPRHDASEAKYGFIKQLKQDSLFNLGPHEKLLLCRADSNSTSQNVKDIEAVIRDWGETIGRGKYLKIEEGCSQGPDDFVLFIAVGSHFEVCGNSSRAAACAAPAKNRQLVLVLKNAEFAAHQDILRHETGHLWAHCDRYNDANPQDKAEMGINCNDTLGGSNEAPSALQTGGTNNPHKITDDDKAGMQRLAADLSIPGNVKWAEFFKKAPKIASTNGYPYCTNMSKKGWGWDESVTDPNGQHSCVAPE